MLCAFFYIYIKKNMTFEFCNFYLLDLTFIKIEFSSIFYNFELEFSKYEFYT